MVCRLVPALHEKALPAALSALQPVTWPELDLPQRSASWSCAAATVLAEQASASHLVEMRATERKIQTCRLHPYAWCERATCAARAKIISKLAPILHPSFFRAFLGYELWRHETPPAPVDAKTQGPLLL